MKKYDRLIILAAVLTITAFVFINIFPVGEDTGVKMHNVEINRVVRVISDTGEIPDIGAYETIVGIFRQTDGEDIYSSRNDYVIREIGGKLYRIEYAEKRAEGGRLYANIVVGAFAVLLIGMMIYLRQTVIKPFYDIRELPVELAKGNFAVPLKERKSRHFGKFLWGMDMLREKIEHTKQSELQLQKEKKTMLMSLSHDIKTPLSAIKLSAKALERGLYTDPEKQRETAGSIAANANEIEKLVNEIMHANSEDIMRFDVKNDEFYLSEVTERVKTFYRDKLPGAEFTVAEFSDCIISGDADRLGEVLRNIIENAIKYGDGHYIRVTFSDEENCRLITVANSGCTLPEEELAHIFDSFWRGSNSGSREGSGLGLYICRNIMSAMGGDIFAEIKNGEMQVTVVCRKG